jgi:hypothetical protein
MKILYIRTVSTNADIAPNSSTGLLPRKTTTMKRTDCLLLSLALFTTGCVHSYYIPNAQNIPLFRQAGDNTFVATGGSGMDDGSTMLDLQGAYALTNNLVVTGGFLYHEQYNYSDEVTSLADATDFTTGTLFEVGAGYYQPLGSIGSFALLGGFGNGRQVHGYDTYTTLYRDYWETESIHETGNAMLRYNRLYIQPSIGLTTKIVDLAFSTRISNTSYYDVYSDLIGQGDEYAALNSLPGLSCWWFEPALTFRLGYAPIKLQFQIYLCEPLSDSNPSAPALGANLGLTFSIPHAKRP